MGKAIKTFHWVTGLLVALVLINWGTVYWANKNIVDAILFNIGFLKALVYSYVSVIGTIWLLVVLGLLHMRGK